ncbi:MAG: hypothetical protein KDE14_06345 [Rhodobacteraceae bacterium]|nr:hypothetical protein [Paracoccaceae bacterium]
MTTVPDRPEFDTSPTAPAGPGGGTVSHYRVEDGAKVIDVTASSVSQLFSGLDPAPFRHKDLDPEVDGYIVAAMREIGGNARVKLVVHLPEDEVTTADGKGLAEAIRNYYAYRAWVIDQDVRRLRKTGALSFVIGAAFLFLCLAGRRVFIQLDAPLDTVEAIVAEGLLIMGWVAMWRPLELALYDWWPVWRQRRLYQRLQDLPVECRPR